MRRPARPLPVDVLGLDSGLVQPSFGAPCIGQYATALVLCDLRCAMLAFIRDPFMTSHASHGPVPVDPLGMGNGLAMHHLCRPAQPSCSCTSRGEVVLRVDNFLIGIEKNTPRGEVS